jgi:hypothetical protein
MLTASYILTGPMNKIAEEKFAGILPKIFNCQFEVRKPSGSHLIGQNT